MLYENTTRLLYVYIKYKYISDQIRCMQNPSNLKYLRISGKEIITCDRVEGIIIGATV